MYTLIDIINKLIEIEKYERDIYEKITTMEEISSNIKTVAKIFKIEKERHIFYYQKLKKRLEQEELPMIDIILYDSVSPLFLSFKNRFIVPHPKTLQEIIHYAYQFEQENKALIIDVKGRLLARESDAGEKIQEVLTVVIQEKERHIQNLKQFLKK